MISPWRLLPSSTNNLSIFSQAQVMLFQYLLGCTAVPGVSTNSNLGSPSLSLPLCCFVLVLGYLFGRANKAEPSSAAVSQSWAEGHLSRRTCPSSSSCRKKGSLQFIFISSCANCSSFGLGKALRLSDSARMQEKQEVLAELPLGAESCRNPNQGATGFALQHPQSARMALLLGLLQWRGVSGLERHISRENSSLGTQSGEYRNLEMSWFERQMSAKEGKNLSLKWRM